jgi:hypothetical protein
MGGRGQGVRRGRSEVRGRVQNGRYDKVRTGYNAGTPIGNRWQVLDQTGEDMDLSIEEVRRERREEIREDTQDRERNREQDDMVGDLRRISQPGTSMRGERTMEGGVRQRETIIGPNQERTRKEIGEWQRGKGISRKDPRGSMRTQERIDRGWMSSISERYLRSWTGN